MNRSRSPRNRKIVEEDALSNAREVGAENSNEDHARSQSLGDNQRWL